MKSFILFCETLLFVGTLQTPSNRSNKDYFNGYSNRQQNNGYNEVKPIIPRNQRQFSNNNNNYQSSRNEENENNYFSWGNVNDQALPQPIPVAATLELPGSQQFSQLPAAINNISVSITEDKVIIPVDNSTSSNSYHFTKEEIACFTESKVFYNDSCEMLLSDDKCGVGEWLILDLKALHQNPPKIVPKCVKRNCNISEFFWQKTKKCYLQNDRAQIYKLCSPGNTIVVDLFGYGTCVCEELYGLHSNGTCYPLYSQGPCSKGYLFIENKNKTECIKNPCENSSLVLYEKDDKRLCYELGKQGPCGQKFLFKVSTTTKKPECFEKVAPLTAIGPPSTCVTTDGSKQCKPEFKVESSKNYLDRIIADANKRKGNT